MYKCLLLGPEHTEMDRAYPEWGVGGGVGVGGTQVSSWHVQWQVVMGGPRST